MKEHNVKVTITVPKALLSKIDKLVDEAGFQDRDEAIRHSMRVLLHKCT